MGLSLCWTTTPKGVLLVKLIEPPLAEPHERWCERSKIPLKEEFSPTRLWFDTNLTPIEKEKEISPNIQINLIRLKMVIMLLN